MIANNCITTAKLGNFDPAELGPEAVAEWELLGKRLKTLKEYDRSHPIFKRLSFLPLFGGIYWKRRLRYVLTKVG